MVGLGLVGMVLGVTVTSVALRRTRRTDRGNRSRWDRGWWLVALAVLPLGASVAPAVVSTVARPVFSMVAALLVVVGVGRALPVRDAARTRESFVEALLAGGVVAYLVAALAGVTTGVLPVGEVALHLGALGTEVAALWIALMHVLRDREGASPAERWLPVALAVLLVGRLALVLDVATTAAGRASLGTAPIAARSVVVLLAIVLIGVAVTRPEVTEPVPAARLVSGEVTGTVTALIAAAVLAGPAVLIVSSQVSTGADPVRTAAAGGLLALLAVLHLVQLVRDHGHRAWQAQHDPLTGLPSEPLFHDRLELALARGRRTDRGVAVAFVDLDRFKRINDRDGHEAGDAVLRVVARRLEAALRAQDSVARRSGDEFLVLLPDVDRPEDVEVAVDRLVVELERPVRVGEVEHRVGASVGLALWPRDGEDADDLLRHADAAMYAAKQDAAGPPRWYQHPASARASS